MLNQYHSGTPRDPAPGGPPVLVRWPCRGRRRALRAGGRPPFATGEPALGTDSTWTCHYTLAMARLG